MSRQETFRQYLIQRATTLELSDYRDIQNPQYVEVVVSGLSLLKQALRPETWQTLAHEYSLLLGNFPYPYLEEIPQDIPRRISPSQAGTWSYFQRQGARHNQEDSSYVTSDKQSTILAVADGVGGHPDGQIASQHIIKILQQLQPKKPDELRTSIIAGLYTLPETPMATTLSVALQYKKKWYLVTIGDSPIVVFRPQQPPLIPELDSGESGTITLCLNSENKLNWHAGISRKLDTSLRAAYTLPPGSKILVATDGIDPFLSDIPQEELQYIMENYGPTEIGLMIQAYIALGFNHIDIDNHTGFIYQT